MGNNRVGVRSFTKEEIQLLRQFRKPHDIQTFLNSISYKSESGTISPKEVMRRREANCFEGALFAAAALKALGRRPLIVDMIADNDDDHVIALFKQNGCYGAVAKSNTTLLRYREPVFRSLRELAMSYFPFYFNINGQMTLRSYSNPVDLSRFDRNEWMTATDNLDYIGDYLCEVKHHELLDRRMILNLSRVDEDIVGMCFNGAVAEGVYRPK